MEKYDLIVLGGGTGGLRLALAAARQDKKTLLIESGKIGGTCLNNGCIPTKALLEAAHRYHSLKELDEFGISVSKPTVNISALLKRVRGIVGEGQKHIKKSLSHSKLTVVKGFGMFVGKKQIQVDSGIYTAKKIVIATGSKNNIAHIPGLADLKFLSNENILLMKALPKSIAIIGGGYISMEFATFFNYLGVKVTILEYAEHILSMLDDDIVTLLEDIYEKKGVTIHKGVETSIEKKKGKYSITYHKVGTNSKPKKLLTDQLLVATGRRPNTLKLNLSQSNVRMNDSHGIVVNKYLRTSVCGIYAMGDALGHDLFAHAVKKESDIILHNLFHCRKRKMDFTLMPWAVFTHPVVAGIGLSEKQAQKKNINYGILKADFKNVGRAKIINEQVGFLKILYNKLSGRIYGASCIGPNADIIIHEVVALMNSNNPSINVLKKTIHIHPTLSEIFGSLR